jgi:hypothetical protein
MGVRFLSCVLLSFLLLGCPVFAATPGQGTTIAQLVVFMRSSIKQKLPDIEVSKYLSKMKLSEKLDASTIEELQSEGLGPKTVAALKVLMTETSSLPAPVALPLAGNDAPKPPPIPPPPYEEEQKLIGDMTEYALSYAKRLPDFLCTQVTRRYVDPRFRDSWITMDTVIAKVSYTEGHENYEVKLVNNTLVENKTLESLNGAISTGEFGSVMEKIFDPRTKAEFHFDHWGKLRGKLMYVFNYAVEQDLSDYSIEFDRKMRIITAYKGLIYVDKAQHQIHRVTAEAVDIPASFPVRAASSVVDYDIATIGTMDFMLPMRAEVRMKDAEAAIKNNIDFRSYRKFGAESEIHYEDILDDDGKTDGKTKETPAVPEPAKK